MRPGILLLMVLLALAALAALLWWRFNGSGRPAAPADLVATRNHHSLRTFHYEPVAAERAVDKAAAPEVGEALGSLLPPEDLAAPEAAHFSAEGPETTMADSPQPAARDLVESPPDTPAAEAPRPFSIRHAAGAPVTPTAEPVPETDEEPAEALFHNPITAPAPTANDQANRAAEIALRQQRRARMSASAATQRTALTELFPGTGSPVRVAKPS